MRSILLVAVGCLLSAVSAHAVVTNVTFFDPSSPPADAECGDFWTEAGVVMHLEPTTADDCGLGPCNWARAHNLPGNISLSPARLVIEASSIPGQIVAVEAVVQDPIGPGDMRLHLYDGAVLLATAANLTQGSQETIAVSANGENVTHIVVSSCGGHVFDVNIEHDPSVPVETSTWGAIKALFD